MCAIVLAFSQHNAKGAEIAPFRITGIETELAFGYFFDEYDTSYAGSTTTGRNGTTYQEQLDVLIHSYFYHPNFLRFDFGGGPVFLQNQFESDLISHSTQEQFFNLHAKANFLEKKDYPLTLYYDRNYSASPPAVQDRMLLKRTRYGLDFSLRNPLDYVPIVNVNMSSYQSEGGNVQRTVNDASDQISLTINTDMGAYGSGAIGYYWLQETSDSGSRLLPITPTKRTTNTLDIQTEHIFGEAREIVVNNYFLYRDQDQLPSQEELWYKPSLNWRHSDNLTSYYRYSYRDRTIEDVDSTLNAGFLGMGYTALEKRLQINLDGELANYTTEGYSQDYVKGSAGAGYQQDFEYFSVHYSAGLTLDRTDRKADVNETPIFAERHILSGTTPVSLNRKYVIAGSIIVRNLASTQTYIEGFDYRLIITGDTTQLQRIPTGNISDGEEVQVDYSYETGGSALFTGVDQFYRIDLYKEQYVKLYAHFQDINRTLVSGNPTLPLNSSRDIKVGFTFDIPFWSTWMVGGKGEMEDYTDEVIPYQGTQYSVYLQMPTPLRGNIRFFADREQVDKDGTPEDIDLTRMGLRYNASPWRGATLTADVIDEEDVGGTKVRTNSSASVRLDWVIRQLTITADARYDKSSIDESERERTKFNIWISRRF
jgi:hypothetical protein